MPMIQAVVRSMAMKAAKGDHRSQKLFSEMIAATTSARVKDQIAMFETAIDYKNSSTKELERQKKLGLTDLPEPLPHPDHVIIDPRQGTVKIIGPATIEEKVKWDKIVELRKFIEEQLVLLIEEIAETKDPKLLKALRKRLGNLRRVIEKANRALGIGED